MRGIYSQPAPGRGRRLIDEECPHLSDALHRANQLCMRGTDTVKAQQCPRPMPLATTAIMAPCVAAANGTGGNRLIEEGMTETFLRKAIVRALSEHERLVFDPIERLARQEDLADRGVRLHPGRHVHRVPVQAELGHAAPHHAAHGLADVDAHANLKQPINSSIQ